MYEKIYVHLFSSVTISSYLTGATAVSKMYFGGPRCTNRDVTQFFQKFPIQYVFLMNVVENLKKMCCIYIINQSQILNFCHGRICFH